VPYKKISGIYKITNMITNKVYIGSSYSVNSRISAHKNLLIKNRHYNTHLQSSFNLHGIENFKFEIIEECSIDDMINKENDWIKIYNANNRLFGYNVRIDCESNRGRVVSDITREKLRISHLGHKRSKETNEKIRKAQNKSVTQISYEGVIINTFESMLEAEKQTGIYRQAISGVCRRTNKSAGGYFWCYSKNIDTFIPLKKLKKKI